MTPRTMRRAYAREAAFMLIVSRLAVRFLPPARLFKWADRQPKRVCRFATHEVDWIVWAFEHIGVHPGMNAPCLPRAVAAHAMLRRRGIPSKLCLGVARSGDAVAAHAWIEVSGRKIVGGEQSGQFKIIAAFGAAT